MHAFFLPGLHLLHACHSLPASVLLTRILRSWRKYKELIDIRIQIILEELAILQVELTVNKATTCTFGGAVLEQLHGSCIVAVW